MKGSRSLRRLLAVRRPIESPINSQSSGSVRSDPVTRTFFSSLSTLHSTGQHNPHCETCTCRESPTTINPYACGLPRTNVTPELPPPLPEPRLTFRRRLLPSALTALNTPQGTTLLIQALVNQSASSYIPLTEQFVNQSDPAFCGVTTLLMVLNTFAIDPNVRWRGGWRYFGDEAVLLSRCCISTERVARVGISLEEFQRLASCQGLRVTMKRPNTTTTQYTLQDFRNDIVQTTSNAADSGIIVVSFSRAALEQTGDGHFSPLAAYHADTDQVLLLDVARFKYQPYWVKVADLYHAMEPCDSVTQKPRGWLLLHPPPLSNTYTGTNITDEGARDSQLVPAVGEPPVCPIHAIKIEYCPASSETKKTGGLV